MRSASYLIMLTVASATGTYLFTAEHQAEPSGVQGGTSQTSATAQPAAEEAAKAEEAAAAKAANETAASSAAVDETASETPADAAGDKAADKGSAAKGSPQRFIPSEQVRADFDVSFPVDI